MQDSVDVLDDALYGAPTPQVEEVKPTSLDVLVANFPFPDIRQAQRTSLEVVAENYDLQRKYTILEIPTGGGKSGISIATASFSAQVGTGTGAHILTSQNNLLTQMMNDFGNLGLRDLKGKANYTCATHKTDCVTGTSVNQGNVCDGCPYRAAKLAYANSPMGVTNYTYFLTEQKHVGQIEPRQYLIADEAHNLEDEVLSTVHIDISPGRAQDLGIEIPTFLMFEQEDVKAWCEKTVLGAIAKRRKALDADVQLAENDLALADSTTKAGRAKALQDIKDKVSSLNTLEDRITEYITSDPDTWLAWTEDRGNLTIRPLSAAPYAQRLFAASPNVLLMSATLLDPRTFARNLGIPLREASYFATPSDFPLENRKMIFLPTGNMGAKEFNNTIPNVIRRVEKILDKFENQKGIIHTHSYKITKMVMDYLATTRHRHRLITHTNMPGAREAAIRRHYMSEDHSVLISPSMTEGLDLRDDLSRFQVICKVPYPFLDPYTRKRMEIDDKWYQLKTALTLVQATGRSVRSATDYANTYILDSAFEQFLLRNADILPNWWKDAIQFR